MSEKKYHVSLTEAEREEIACWSKSQRRSERERKRARILLLADENQAGGAKKDSDIAQAVRVAPLTVNRVRQRFTERGLEPSLRRKEQENRKPRLLDGEGEAHLIALVCSAPPDGHKRWGLHLLKDTLIEQRIVDTISHEAVRQTLKKMRLSRG
jgi:transposase